MDFSLSSSLVGNAVSNPDKLALDLQFAADKTLTARKGPTPAFTRGSNATVVGSDGLVRYAPNNAALYSGQLVVGTGWSANATPSVTSIVDGLGPDGNNAYEVAEIANTGSHTLFNTGGTGTTGAISVVSGTTYTGSIFVKKVVGSVNWIQLSFSTVGFGSVQYANFNISNGTIGNFSSSSPQIQDAGNGWYRCSISAVATSTTTTTSNLFLAFTNNTDTTSRLLSYAGNTANKILAAMCQFEIGSTVNTYNPTTTSAVYGPRFDHDPVTLACKGLLIEESRTNLVFPSDTLTTQTRTVTAVAHTLSFYGTGTVVLSGVAIATVVGSGVYPARTTLTFTPTAGSLILTVTGTVQFAQLEAGAFPTSYIPTTTASVIRSAEVCSISGSDVSGMFNQSAGTLESKAMIANLVGNLRGITQIDDGTNANILRHIYGLSDGGFRSLIRSNSDTITALSITLGAASTIQKRAIAYEGTSFASVTNGGTVSTATRTMPVGLSTLRIGNIAEGSFYLSGHIASIRYYKKRLPNTKLASLTV